MAVRKRQPVTEVEFRTRMTGGGTIRAVELREADLSGTAAPGLVLRDCQLAQVNLALVNWEEVTCTGCAFVGCRFDDAQLVGGRFTNCTFFEAESALTCTFARTRLRFATFEDCLLDSCVFEDADVENLTIHRSRGIGARFYKATFAGAATLTENVLRYADLRDAELGRCDLSKNDLEWALLDGAQLQEANLRETTLNRASLRGASLRGADLRNANLGGFDPRILDARGALIVERQMRQILESMDFVITADVE